MNTSYMATQISILQSERVALRAIQALRIDQDPTLRAQWQESTQGVGSFQSWVADLLLRNLEALPSRDSNVITVSYTSPDPRFAALVANAWINAYVGTVLDLRVEPAKQYNNFFDARGKQLRDDLERAQSRLSAFLQTNGLIVTDERLDVENQRLAELTSQLVSMQSIANESTSRQQQATGVNADRMQEVLNNSLVTGLTADISRKQAQLQELTTRFGDNYPQVVELRASIRELSTRIADETKRVQSSVGITNDINQDRTRKLTVSVSQQREKLLELKTLRDQAAVLQRDVENSKRMYDEMMSRASLTNVVSQTTQTNVSVLKVANPPAQPSSPRIPLNMAIGILAGLMLGLAAAIAREALDRRLRTGADVARTLRLPMLGVLPVASRSAKGSSARTRLTGKTATRALPGSLPSPRT